MKRATRREIKSSFLRDELKLADLVERGTNKRSENDGWSQKEQSCRFSYVLVPLVIPRLAQLAVFASLKLSSTDSSNNIQTTSSPSPSTPSSKKQDTGRQTVQKT